MYPLSSPVHKMCPVESNASESTWPVTFPLPPWKIGNFRIFHLWLHNTNTTVAHRYIMIFKQAQNLYKQYTITYSTPAECFTFYYAKMFKQYLYLHYFSSWDIHHLDMSLTVSSLANFSEGNQLVMTLIFYWKVLLCWNYFEEFVADASSRIQQRGCYSEVENNTSKLRLRLGHLCIVYTSHWPLPRDDLYRLVNKTRCGRLRATT